MLRDLAVSVIDSRAENAGSPATAGFAVDGVGICCKQSSSMASARVHRGRRATAPLPPSLEDERNSASVHDTPAWRRTPTAFGIAEIGYCSTLGPHLSGRNAAFQAPGRSEGTVLRCAASSRKSCRRLPVRPFPSAFSRSFFLNGFPDAGGRLSPRQTRAGNPDSYPALLRGLRARFGEPALILPCTVTRDYQWYHHRNFPAFQSCCYSANCLHCVLLNESKRMEIVACHRGIRI